MKMRSNVEINTIKTSVSGLNKRHLGLHIHFRINNVSIKMLWSSGKNSEELS